MNSCIIHGVEPTIQLSFQPTIHKLTTTYSVSRVLFTPNLTNSSRIATTTRPGSRSTTRVQSFNVRAETKEETLYQVLGISKSCSTELDIKKAYKQMARKYHPDVSPPERVDENTKKFIMVHEAYEILSNPHSKACYDRDLTVGWCSGFSHNKFHQYNKGSEVMEEWKFKLDELINQKKRNKGNMSWAARVRNKNVSI